MSGFPTIRFTFDTHGTYIEFPPNLTKYVKKEFYEGQDSHVVEVPVQGLPDEYDTFRRHLTVLAQLQDPNLHLMDIAMLKHHPQNFRNSHPEFPQNDQIVDLYHYGLQVPRNGLVPSLSTYLLENENLISDFFGRKLINLYNRMDQVCVVQRGSEVYVFRGDTGLELYVFELLAGENDSDVNVSDDEQRPSPGTDVKTPPVVLRTVVVDSHELTLIPDKAVDCAQRSITIRRNWLGGWEGRDIRRKDGSVASVGIALTALIIPDEIPYECDEALSNLSKEARYNYVPENIVKICVQCVVVYPDILEESSRYNIVLPHNATISTLKSKLMRVGRARIQSLQGPYYSYPPETEAIDDSEFCENVDGPWMYGYKLFFTATPIDFTVVCLVHNPGHDTLVERMDNVPYNVTALQLRDRVIVHFGAQLEPAQKYLIGPYRHEDNRFMETSIRELVSEDTPIIELSDRLNSNISLSFVLVPIAR